MSQSSGPGGVPDEVLVVYAIRFSIQARRDVLNEAARLGELTGKSSAAQWYRGLYGSAGTLATQPRRNALLERESRWIRRDVRRLIYRRTADSKVAYLLYYVVNDVSADGPQVEVIHVRHGAQKPLTAKEARQMRDAF